jgi:hypothetical protein
MIEGILEDGGEGVILRKVGSKYEHGRTSALIKLKVSKNGELKFNPQNLGDCPPQFFFLVGKGGRGKREGEIGKGSEGGELWVNLGLIFFK